MALALGAPLLGATGWLMLSTQANASSIIVRTASTVSVMAQKEQRLVSVPVPHRVLTAAPTLLPTVRTLPNPSTTTSITTVLTTTTTTTQLRPAPVTIAVVATAPISVPLPTTPGWRLLASRTYADGSLAFRPMDPSVRPKRTQAVAIGLARKAAGPATGNSAVTAQYAQYDAAVGSWLGSSTEADGGTEARPVWVVVFLAVVGQRSTGVVERQHVSTPSTTSRRVVTDVLVVLDDVTGEVIVRSEYSSSAL